MKGISSVQLYHDGNRWWILSWLSQSKKTDSLTKNSIENKHHDYKNLFAHG